jgi:cytochrome c2
VFRWDKPLTWAAALVALAITGVLIAGEVYPPYRPYQLEFRRLVSERFGPERAAATPTGVRQIWLPESDRVDRCTTCHLGMTWEGLEDAPQPFASHPAEILESHPLERFGCTWCHGGQGPATELPDAHGWVEHWEQPLLDSQLAAAYGVDDPAAFLELRCNTCHRYDREIDGAPHINRAKQIVESKGCRACHVINERGGSIGPDLTRTGEKGPEQYDYARLTSLPSLLEWHIGHLQSPKSFSPESVMPDFGFSRDDALALTLLLLSWGESDVPADLRPGAILRDVPTAEEAERERMMREGPGRFFVEKTCFICHDVSSLGIESATKIGPDLALAVEDAPRRFGRTLDDFMMNPSGTMSVVLSKQIQLTPEERREAVRLLKIAHERYLEQQSQRQSEQNAERRAAAAPGAGPAAADEEEASP